MSQETTAKVVELLNKRKWDGPNGTIYYQTVKMDNGDVGSIGKKKEDHFRVGDSITYTKEQRGEYTDFKEVRSNNFSGAGGGSRAASGKSNAQLALECATSVFLERNKINASQAPASEIADGITVLAEKFHTWLSGKN